MRKPICILLGLCLAAAWSTTVAGEKMDTATPPQLVATYDNLADAILAVKKTEWNLVHSILATTYGHAEGTMAKAKAKLQAGKDAKAEIEALAALVSQLGNEGDNAVAGIRKRLVEGGHHHHSKAEKAGVYDEGFVIVTREAKKAFLDAAGKIARASSVGALESEWRKVQQQFKALHKDVSM